MARTTMQMRLRLAAHARLLLHVAAVLACMGIRIPHRWIVAVTNRAWSMEVGGVWQQIRIDNSGRIIQ